MAHEFAEIDYRKYFTVDEFARRAAAAAAASFTSGGPHVKARIRRTVSGRTIVEKILSRPQTDFALVLLASLPSVDDNDDDDDDDDDETTDLEERFANFVDTCVQVFPLFLIENVRSEYWAVVTRGPGRPKRIQDGAMLTLSVVRNLIKRAKLAATASLPQSSAAAAAAAADNNDDDDDD
ncbi:hypothetical protein RF55_14468 [Lasius niger]|uniref:Uncharacterized protein n=1 Tax=Lasius niger TaxID=67767 RepID=A0A0J7K8A9_LASNI|nr:hypothetical protein RF55_14468 [Lasius niger]